MEKSILAIDCLSDEEKRECVCESEGLGKPNKEVASIQPRIATAE
jgi:hypothetical protein